jgi:hypothetical protein
MRLRLAGTFGSLVLSLALTASHSYAGPITLPAGLAPGSEYRLVFVTADAWSATSSNIADYNDAVNNEANSVAALASLGTTWLDIGSTPTVNAIDNIGQDAGIPIYNLGGLIVAHDATTSAGGLFSGFLIDSIGYNEFGESTTNPYPGPEDNSVWTGTGSFGTAVCPLGGGIECSPEECPPACSGFALLGDPLQTVPMWVDSFTVGPQSSGYSLYAISGILTVPSSSIPEPSSIVMLILGSPVLLFVMKGRREALSPT